MSIILAIETSQRSGGVALRDRDGNAHVEMLRTATGRHDDDLMPAIDRLFRRASLVPSDLGSGSIGVSIGPGGFTGLRIAISTAKMLAEATGAKLIAVPSALVVAESASLEILVDSDLVVALSAKGASAWCTRLKRASSEWHIVGEPGLHDARSLDFTNVAAVLADDHLPPPLRAACESAGLSVHQPTFNPVACLNIAGRMIARNEFTDSVRLLPLYPRPPEAVSLWDKKLMMSKDRDQ